MNDTRTRGIMVYPMPEAVTGGYDAYALLVREDGDVRMVHSEGVAYVVSEEKPWTWNDFSPACPSYSPADLITLAIQSPPVDLADWIRTFGHRLESNFHQIVGWSNDC